MIEVLKDKKVLGIFAHADDEIVAGWPIFQDESIDRTLVIMCDDVKRKGQGRIIALQEVCKVFNIRLFCAGNLDTEFYRLPTRYDDFVLTDALRLILSIITQAVLDVKPDYIMTHNPVGEYGHGDHRLLFEMVTQRSDVTPVIITDLCEENSCHRSSKYIPDSIAYAYYDGMHQYDVKMNNFYEKGMNIYRKYGAWTWKNELPNVNSCKLYIP